MRERDRWIGEVQLSWRNGSGPQRKRKKLAGTLETFALKLKGADEREVEFHDSRAEIAPLHSQNTSKMPPTLK